MDLDGVNTAGVEKVDDAKNRVVHLTSVHAPYDNRILYKECATLAAAGFDVFLVAPHEHDEMVEGVQIKAVPRLKGRLRRMLLTAGAVYRQAKRLNADIYHVHDPELLPFAQLLRRFSNAQVIFDMHESLPKQLLTKSWLPARFRPLVSLLYRSIERKLLAGVHVVFAEDSYRDDYPWLTGIVIHNFPQAEHLLGIERPRAQNPTVGYLGGVAAGRGSEITLEALRILRESGLDVQFECIGPATQVHQAHLTSFCHQVGLTNVHYRGYLPPREAIQLIAACHVGLAVLQPNPNYIDSYPTKLFEYMALGLPVITSDFPLYRSIVEPDQCGLCVNPSCPQGLADALRYLITHPVEAKAMGQRGKEAVRKYYNWEMDSQELLRLYRRLVRQPERAHAESLSKTTQVARSSSTSSKDPLR